LAPANILTAQRLATGRVVRRGRRLYSHFSFFVYLANALTANFQSFGEARAETCVRTPRCQFEQPDKETDHVTLSPNAGGRTSAISLRANS